MGQGEVLEYLEKKKIATAEEIARDLNKSKSAVLKLLKILEQDGLVVVLQTKPYKIVRYNNSDEE